MSIDLLNSNKPNSYSIRCRDFQADGQLNSLELNVSDEANMENVNYNHLTHFIHALTQTGSAQGPVDATTHRKVRLTTFTQNLVATTGHTRFTYSQDNLTANSVLNVKVVGYTGNGANNGTPYITSTHNAGNSFNIDIYNLGPVALTGILQLYIEVVDIVG